MNSLPRMGPGVPFRKISRCLARVGLALTIGVLPASSRKRILFHFYCVNDPASLHSLQTNVVRPSLVSPQWFTAGRTGQLDSAVDASVVEWAKKRKIRLMPLLINEKFQPEVAHAVLGDERIQSALLREILDAAVAGHFYGIQLDFENIPSGDREAYSRFVETFTKAFHRRHKKLSVAVPAPLGPPPTPATSVGPAFVSWTTNEHSLAFDYRELGQVADSVTLMTYDEYDSPDLPGPIAGFPWVEACLQKTLKFVSSKKLFLGIPLYYRRWSGKTVSEGPYDEAVGLAAQWGAKIETDAEQKEKIVKFADGQNSHVVWLNDSDSVRERVEWAVRQGLAGFSAWRLGQEDRAVWIGVFSQASQKGQ